MNIGDDQLFLTAHRVDGIEYRIFLEISKHWNATINLHRIHPNENWDPYETIRMDVTNKSSDMAMCSIWLTYENYNAFDLTSFIDRQCITFLVPVQKLISDVSTIYIALSGAVWALYIGTCIIVGILLIIMANIYFKQMNVGYKIGSFDYLSESYMNLVNIASAHGIQRFPKPIALKTIFMRYDRYILI